MAAPVLKLNLAPPPTLWHQHHETLGWAGLAIGTLALLITVGASVLAYRKAQSAGKTAILKTKVAKELVRKQQDLQNRLRDLDVEKELPRWRLAERILMERSSPWSRLTAELERSLVQDVRIKSIQRTRDSAQQVQLKIRGEARTRAAEEEFLTSLHENAFFAQVILERESERQGGGVEFEYTLPISSTPPAYVALPLYGPTPKTPNPGSANPAPPPISPPVPPPGPPPGGTKTRGPESPRAMTTMPTPVMPMATPPQPSPQMPLGPGEPGPMRSRTRDRMANRPGFPQEPRP